MDEEKLDSSQVYELGYHILPAVPEEKISGIVSKLQGLVSENGGTIISEDFPKMRGLAYDIKKRVEGKYFDYNKAYFGWIKFETPPASAAKIKDEVQNDENILRFIILKTVRENTMSSVKPPVISREPKEEIKKAPKEKSEASEEEIDKSIDELVKSETL